MREEAWLLRILVPRKRPLGSYCVTAQGQRLLSELGIRLDHTFLAPGSDGPTSTATSTLALLNVGISLGALEPGMFYISEKSLD